MRNLPSWFQWPNLSNKDGKYEKNKCYNFARNLEKKLAFKTILQVSSVLDVKKHLKTLP